MQGTEHRRPGTPRDPTCLAQSSDSSLEVTTHPQTAQSRRRQTHEPGSSVVVGSGAGGQAEGALQSAGPRGG